jgi:hypothetical protein
MYMYIYHICACIMSEYEYNVACIYSGKTWCDELHRENKEVIDNNYLTLNNDEQLPIIQRELVRWGYRGWGYRVVRMGVPGCWDGGTGLLGWGYRVVRMGVRVVGMWTRG